MYDDGSSVVGNTLGILILGVVDGIYDDGIGDGGKVVGIEVGDLLGTRDGIDDGCKVVGLKLGTLLGAHDGATGAIVGVIVGAVVGVTVDVCAFATAIFRMRLLKESAM